MRAEAKLHIPSTTIKSQINFVFGQIGPLTYKFGSKNEIQFLCQIISILFVVLGIYNFGHRLRLVTKTGGSLYGIFRRHRRQTKAGNYYILHRACERKSWEEFKIIVYTYRYSPKILMTFCGPGHQSRSL